MGSNYTVSRLVAFSCLLASCIASAAPPPVYRCETNGRVAYSDSPCVGAKIIDATPNQGVDEMSGQSRKGADVQRAETNNAFDDALKPLTGKSRGEMEVLRRRVRLPSQHQAECARLDHQLSVLEGGGGSPDATARAEAEVRLYQVRKRFFDLKC
jgi:hypothetical protein